MAPSRQQGCCTAEAPTERIGQDGETLAILVRSEFRPSGTTFLTSDEQVQQMGFVVYPAGSEIPRHEHSPTKRTIRGTPECLVVRQGKTEVTFYDRRRREVCRRVVSAGDVLLLLAGGHGFRQIEDTVFLEIKQGPYAGVEDKVRF